MIQKDTRKGNKKPRVYALGEPVKRFKLFHGLLGPTLDFLQILSI